MIRSSRLAVSTLGVALLAAGMLAGCATGDDPAAPTLTPGPDVELADDIDAEAAWLDGGRMIGVVTDGSSSCVPTAGEATFSDGVIEVEFIEPDATTACTRDMVPRATLFATPEGVDPTQDVEVRITGPEYVGVAELDGVAGLSVGGETDYLPTAGWTDEDGQFVLLSWGSSTCPPIPEDAVATGPDEITATFATPPADQVCTMDMAPRGTVLFVDDLERDGETFVILEGGEFDNIRIPIVGAA